MTTAPPSFDRQALINHRVRSGFSIRGLASEAGVSFSHLAAIERGESAPTPGMAKKLAGALGIELSELLKVAA